MSSVSGSTGPLGLLLGSALAIPLFVAAFVVAALGAYVVCFVLPLLFISMAFPDSLYTKLGAMFATLSITWMGVLGARWALDRWIKRWSGWPILVLAAPYCVFTAWQTARGDGFYSDALVATGANLSSVVFILGIWFYIVRRAPPP